MLRLISWSDYSSALLFITTIYYIIIGYIYFRNELLKLTGIVRHPQDGLQAAYINDLSATRKSRFDEPAQETSLGAVDITPIVQAFLAEVNSYLEQARDDRAARQEILYALRQISARYPVLAGSDDVSGLVKEVHGLANRLFGGAFAPGELKAFLFTEK